MFYNQQNASMRLDRKTDTWTKSHLALSVSFVFKKTLSTFQFSWGRRWKVVGFNWYAQLVAMKSHQQDRIFTLILRDAGFIGPEFSFKDKNLQVFFSPLKSDFFIFSFYTPLDHDYTKICYTRALSITLGQKIDSTGELIV